MSFTSDSNGGLAAEFDPSVKLPPLYLDDQYVLYGAGQGEILHFSANDGRSNPADLTGLLWSNTLNVTA
ncbi:hypothetical protein [Streptomyces sp. NPDC049906]|uniref:hypothetical protein n=1 Tax=Streptomyces sp. NPDC049906 TaxID=3155656 RepID=UPI003436EBE4